MKDFSENEAGHLIDHKNAGHRAVVARWRSNR